MVFLPKIIPRVPSSLSLRFKPSDFKYTLLELPLDGTTSPEQRWGGRWAGRFGCTERPRWKTMSTLWRFLTVTTLVGICVAIQVTIILLIRSHYRKQPAPEIPDSIKFPWRQFPEYVVFWID